ncbi:hypothetical protein [Luteolibacter luteus]|uniref:Uncharacterized protein n=1 Tax=Luteolibacter luteus TaxID=2728835 RepID=A0A858RKL3_9BACT|nr:hypothetical protein [Luteolibacter luteus]QJE96929.1 hypothetical protein HHL09_14415 [Luteolibacter luteus]
MGRRFLLILATVVLVTAVAVWQRPPGGKAAETKARMLAAGPVPDVESVDPVAVFQRAFWKRPAEGDSILNAVRREWKDEGEISRWQWFLEVEPSPALVSYLREDNAFRLSEKKPPSIPGDAPKWFIKDPTGMHVMVARHGGMQLFFLPGNTKLYAMDRGGGFQAGEPEKEPAVPTSEPGKSRLPLSSPPQANR